VSRPQAAPARAAGGMDRVIRSLAGVTVAGLAGLAGAISYSHMRVLAGANGQAGWHAHAFPLSVDGVEIVASLVLLADRRTGRRSGWLPWTALAVGTAASLAANVATAGPDPISRVIAGWPALALLIAVKLLSGMLEHRGTADDAAAVPVPAAHPGRDGPRPERLAPAAVLHASARPTRRRQARRPRSEEDAVRPATISMRADPAPVGAVGPDGHRPVTRSRGLGHPDGTGIVPNTAADATDLLQAARAAHDDLCRDGRPLTRDALAARLRRDGHHIRNTRLTPLLHALREEAADRVA